jgi:hypothetical protein
MKLIVVAVAATLLLAACSSSAHTTADAAPHTVTKATETPIQTPTPTPTPKIASQSVIGMPMLNGYAALQAQGFQINVKSSDGSTPQDSWIIATQTPSPGSPLAAGSLITIVVTTPPPVITYTITGNGTASSITWSNESGQTQASNVRLPWSVTVPEGASYGIYIVLAQDGTGTSITCTISRGADVIATNTATGRYSIAQCQSQ